MKSRETLIRLKKFQVDERRRKVAQIETMIAEFERMAADLEREIKVEQDRAGIHDPGHFAYPTYAKAAIQRRENLARSADELRIQLEDAKALLAEAFEELKQVELLDERDQARERRQLLVEILNVLVRHIGEVEQFRKRGERKILHIVRIDPYANFRVEGLQNRHSRLVFLSRNTEIYGDCFKLGDIADCHAYSS